MRLRDVSRVVRGGWLGLFLAALSAFTAVDAYAQELCYRYWNNVAANGVQGQFFNSPDELLAAVLDYRYNNGVGCGSGNTGGAGSGTYCDAFINEGCGSYNYETGSGQCFYRTQRQPVPPGACSGSGGSVNCNPTSPLGVTINREVDPAGCPPPPDEECEDIGKSKVLTGSGMAGFSWCEGVCRWQVQFGMCNDEGTCDYLASIVSSCGGAGPGDDPPDGPPDGADDGGADPSDTPPESCVEVGDGEFCIGGSAGDKCGYFNDTYTCVDQVRDDECKVAADGSRLCGDQVKGTPPAPDNGTPGEVATPDGTVTVTDSQGNTTTYNYYSSSTVAGSSRDPGTTGASAASGAGSPHAPSQGDGDGDGQDDCEQTGACGGGEEIVSTGPCYDDGEGFVGVVSACVQEAFSYISEALYEENEWYELAISIADSVPSGGTCPSARFSAFGESYDFGDVACDFIEDAEPTLGLMFLILWSFVALRILIGTFAEA